MNESVESLVEREKGEWGWIGSSVGGWMSDD